jgi:Domain of unknown function (DUF4268)
VAGLFNQLSGHRDEIEAAFGGSLLWEAMDGKRACVIRCTLSGGGYKSADEDWDRLQDAQTDAMIRLERALKPFIQKLKGER